MTFKLLPDTDAKQKQTKEMAMQQWQTTLEQLSANPPAGRVTIRVSSHINRWKNTISDVEVRAGDLLVVPKRPSFVMVTGQVFNPTAVSYRRGKSAKWYLGQSGGPTTLANKKAIFVIRADGSVIGSQKSLFIGRPAECIAATGGHRRRPGEGAWRRPPMAERSVDGTSRFRHCQHHYSLLCIIDG